MGGAQNIQLHHINANPLRRASLAAAVDVAQFHAALILSDSLWHSGGRDDAAHGTLAEPPGTGGEASSASPSGDSGSAVYGAALEASIGSQQDALRMDAAVLSVHLNIRMLLQVGRPVVALVPAVPAPQLVANLAQRAAVQACLPMVSTTTFPWDQRCF